MLLPTEKEPYWSSSRDPVLMESASDGCYWVGESVDDLPEGDQGKLAAMAIMAPKEKGLDIYRFVASLEQNSGLRPVTQKYENSVFSTAQVKNLAFMHDDKCFVVLVLIDKVGRVGDYMAGVVPALGIEPFDWALGTPVGCTNLKEMLALE